MPGRGSPKKQESNDEYERCTRMNFYNDFALNVVIFMQGLKKRTLLKVRVPVDFQNMKIRTPYRNAAQRILILILIFPFLKQGH